MYRSNPMFLLARKNKSSVLLTVLITLLAIYFFTRLPSEQPRMDTPPSEMASNNLPPDRPATSPESADKSNAKHQKKPVNGAEDQTLNQLAPDYGSLLLQLQAGNLEAGRNLYQALDKCHKVPVAWQDVENWRAVAQTESNPRVRARLDSLIVAANNRFKYCSTLTQEQRRSLADVLMIAAQAGDAEASVRLLQLEHPTNAADPLDDSKRAQRGRVALELASQIVRNGNPLPLLEMANALERDVFGYDPSNARRAYEALFAWSLAHTGDSDPFPQITERRMVALRERLSQEDLREAEERAAELIKQCCS